MRLTIAAAIAAILLMPAAIPASAGSAPALSAAQRPTDFSAAKKKAKKATAKAKAKKPKVEYMRAVPMR